MSNSSAGDVWWKAMPTEPAYRVSRRDQYAVRERKGSKNFWKTAYFRISSQPVEESIDPSKLELLPSTAEAFYGDELEKFRWEGTLEVLFAGSRDNDSPLALLREHEATIIREIYSFIANRWAGHVKLTVPAALVGNALIPRERKAKYMQFNHGRHDITWSNRILREDAATTSNGFDNGFVSFASCGHVEFPEPAGRNVNMMPFIFGDRESLPSYLQCYFTLIEQCPYMRDDEGKTGYLTVHESFVGIGEAQRREGLHIESPGFFADDESSPSFTPGVEHHWGAGDFRGPDKYEGGIFMASSVANTSEVWNALVDSKVPGIVDRHGGCEHLRGLIGQGMKLRAGELVWMTDCTPHEALPQKESCHRQFFRVVTPCISHWHADHSTRNPNVPLPPNVIVVKGNKFG